MENVINFIELAATLLRNDGRVTAQHCRLVRLHSRQSRSIYFSHDTYESATKGETEIEREKSNYLAQKCRFSLRIANRHTAPFVLSVMKYCLPVRQYRSQSRILFRWLCLWAIIIHVRFLDRLILRPLVSNHRKWPKEDRDLRPQTCIIYL